MKNRFLGLLLISCSVIAGSCIKAGGECEEPADVISSSLIVDFKDSSGKYLYTRTAPSYNKESLMCFDERRGTAIPVGSSLNFIPNTLSEYWRINIGPVYYPSTDDASFNTEVCKNFILRYRANEFDTLRACFKARKTKCGSIFETLKVYYKGQLIADKTNDTYAELTVIKR